MNHHGIAALVSLLALSTLASPNARADVLLVTPAADTSLFQFAPDNNLGATRNLIVGATSNGLTNRALVRFNFNAIPVKSVIHSVSLTLVDTTAANPFNNSNFRLHRMTSSWFEGAGTNNQGTPALFGETTWNSQNHDIALWPAPGTQAGVNYVTNISAQTPVNTNLGKIVWESNSNLVADVKRWITNGSPNYGWLILSESESTAETSRRFASREDLLGRAPVLRVEFTPVVELNPVADTSLFEPNPNNNLGGVDFMAVGRTFTGMRSRGLLQFEVAPALPSNAIVTGATLQVRILVNASGSNTVHGLHRVLVPWGEGNKATQPDGMTNVGSIATAGEATWLARQQDTALWASPGGAAGTDYIVAASATQILGNPNTNGTNFASAQLAADVQAWLNVPSTNFGWMLIGQGENSVDGARRIASRESSVGQPVLTLTYTVPDSNAPPEIISAAASNDQFLFTFLAEAGRNYSLERRTTLTGGSWTNFSNVGPILIASNHTGSDAIGASNTFYRVVRLPLP